MMVHAAADDVRFLPYIYHKMMEKLNESSLWKLAVRGALYCRCFCASNNNYADWPSVPTIPGFLFSGLFTTTTVMLKDVHAHGNYYKHIFAWI